MEKRIKPDNIFDNIPLEPGPQELTTVLAEGRSARIERIVSCGHITPEGEWYDQSEDEWVALLEGEAILNLDGRAVRLLSGDSLMIPARLRHRVDYTSADIPCVWLCVFGDFSPRG